MTKPDATGPSLRDPEVEALLVAAERIWADHLSGYEPGIAAMSNLFAAIPPLRLRATLAQPATSLVETLYVDALQALVDAAESIPYDCGDDHLDAAVANARAALSQQSEKPTP